VFWEPLFSSTPLKEPARPPSVTPTHRSSSRFCRLVPSSGPSSPVIAPTWLVDDLRSLPVALSTLSVSSSRCSPTRDSHLSLLDVLSPVSVSDSSLVSCFRLSVAGNSFLTSNRRISSHYHSLHVRNYPPKDSRSLGFRLPVRHHHRIDVGRHCRQLHQGPIRHRTVPNPYRSAIRLGSYVSLFAATSLRNMF
jgi:hypothetical protein